MRRFSSSYVYRQSNFVLLGCEQFGNIDNEWAPVACIVENLIQRGMPTYPSNRLVSTLGGTIELGQDRPNDLDIARPARKLITHDCKWANTIKGSPGSDFNPALDFFTTLLPSALPPDKKWLIGYILPEALISDIVPDCDSRFAEQRVDFYCPRAKLVIEIDGSQHARGAQSFLDRDRDLYLRIYGIKTVRIKVDELNATIAVRELIARFDEGDELPAEYDEADIFPYEIAIRSQIAITTLVKQGMLSPNDPTWTIDFTCDRPDIDGNALIRCATEDILDLVENICILMDKPFTRPEVITSNKAADVRLNVSATKMWSELESEPSVVYARNDYYEDIDNFEVAHAEPVIYKTGKESTHFDFDRHDEIQDALKFFLKYIFGYDDFRPGQDGVIRKALTRSATLGILPTGSGKSLCYQMACLLQPCISFVVCPIISLIQDQELNSHEFGIDRVGRIDSQMVREKKNEVLDAFGSGKYFFVWISPERFQTVDFRMQLNELSNRRHFGYAVIDEVHCLSEWGHDFRVSYLKLYGTIKKFCPEAQIIALTATASRNVLQDLLSELEITKENVQTTANLDRPELKFHIVEVTEQGREEELDKVLGLIDEHFRDTEGVDSIFEPRGKDSICGIIFSNIKNSSCSYASSCEGVLAHLKRRGIQADSYHADRNERSDIQEEFLKNQFTVMSATKAFGMGVNKKNVRYTIHNGLPWSIEAFYQEAGRAGRDPMRNESECYILYSNESNQSDVKRLFKETTSVGEIVELQPSLKGDLGTLFFLWSGNHEDLETERLAIVATFKWMRRNRDKNGHVIMSQNLVWELMSEVAIERAKQRAETAEKAVNVEIHLNAQDALYKLAILGIVVDWTVDYRTKTYDVEMREINGNSEELVKGKLEEYIKRHNPTFSFDSKLPAHRKYIETYRSAPNGKKLIGLIDVLLKWTNDNIVFSRRRAIGNMLDLCTDTTRGRITERGLHEYLNSYFRLDTESNDQLDAIVRDSNHISTWFRLFTTYKLTDDPAVQVDVLKDGKEIESIAALCDRYRESFHANIGLEWATMVAKLLSGTFSGSDVDSQFSFITNEAKEYDELDSDELFEQTVGFLEQANSDAKDAFGAAVVNHAPSRALQTYEKLNDAPTLTYLVNVADSRLKTKWRRSDR